MAQAASSTSALSTLTNQSSVAGGRARGVKSPCTRSQTRRNDDAQAHSSAWPATDSDAAMADADDEMLGDESLQLCDMPDEVLLHALTHLACAETVPGSVDGGPTFKSGSDAIVLGGTSRAARQWKRAQAVSRRWRLLTNAVTPWREMRTMDLDDDLSWDARKINADKEVEKAVAKVAEASRYGDDEEALIIQGKYADKLATAEREAAEATAWLAAMKDKLVLHIEQEDLGHGVWAASSTSREEGKADKWHTVRAPGGDRSVILVRKCNEEGVSYDVVRWMGCLQAMHHPCIAALQLARAAHNPSVAEHTMVHAGMEWVDTSVQKIVYGTLERTSHTVFGRALPPLMLRSFLYQLLHALAHSHARGVAHGNLAPYRVLATTLDKDKDHYLLKLGDFGFSPPFAALSNEELPIRPSRASPELHADHKLKRYGPKNDIWALGTVFAEMTCGNRDPTVYVMIQELESTPEEQFQTNLPMLCANGRDLMRKMLRLEPDVRIAAADALCHPYFDGLHDECAVVAKYLPHTMPPPTEFLEVRVPTQWTAGCDFLDSQPNLNARMWTILYDWLAVVSYKFKFVPRSLQLACDFMLRYMSQIQVERKALQLVGIGALCLACKHEEVMIPNMNDFIFICDNAYTLQELMVMEVDILTTLQVQLHMPTPHDMLLPMLQSLDEAPSYPDASIDPSPLRNWCEALLLLGQAQYQVVLHDPSTLARCVATLGGLLSRGCHSVVFQRDGSVAEGKKGGKLAERVCWLKPGADWRCLEELLDGIESAACESREMLVKCHSKFIEMHSLSDILDKFRNSPDGGRKAGHLTHKEVKPLLERHYPTEWCKSQQVYHDRADEDAPPPDPKARKCYLKSGRPGVEATYSIVTVTLALGRQLLAEHGKA